MNQHLVGSFKSELINKLTFFYQQTDITDFVHAMEQLVVTTFFFKLCTHEFFLLDPTPKNVCHIFGSPKMVGNLEPVQKPRGQSVCVCVCRWRKARIFEHLH